MVYTNRLNHFFVYISIALCSVTLLSAFVLASSTSSADDIVSNVSITVPVSCNVTSTLDDAHTATINNDTFEENIGTTTFKTICNDNSGYALYAIGYSNEEFGNTKLLATVGGQLSPTNDIATGLATSGDTSAWAMKLSPVAGTYAPTIESDTNGSFSNYHIVPDTYTKVATFTSNTDAVIGSSVQSTYRAYVDRNKPAGTYTGKVRYSLVHPNDALPPEDPRFVAMLDIGTAVNQKLKRLAGNSSATYTTQDNTITALARSDTLPTGFTPATNNIISASTSLTPIYAWYDSENTTIYYYSESANILMNQNSSYFFREMRALSDFSTISTWDTSSVTNMSYMFSSAGRSATTFTLDLSSWDTSSVTNMVSMFTATGRSATSFNLNLSSWDTSNVIDMSDMFSGAGYSATTWSIGDLSSWDTSSVTNMSQMFYRAGYSATTWSIGDLSSWNTSKVTSMSGMFDEAGYNAVVWSIGNISSWSTSSVTNMVSMFWSAGYSAATWSIGDLSSWDTSSVTDMSFMFNSAGHSVTTFNLDLSSWNTSKVTSMSGMFNEAGYNAVVWSIGNISSWDTSSVAYMDALFYSAGYSATTFALDLSFWDTSNVTYMAGMFEDAGANATTWSVTIPKTNNGTASGAISNTASNLYGNSTSVTATPLSGKSFTLAN